MQKYLILLLLLCLLTSGCSNKADKIGTKAQESNGVRIYLSSDPDPMETGANTLYLRLVDTSSGQAIVNANVAVSAYNALAGGGDRESGRSQGNGEYAVPIQLGIPDTYKMDVQVQRPGQPDSDVTFIVTAEQKR